MRQSVRRRRLEQRERANGVGSEQYKEQMLQRLIKQARGASEIHYLLADSIATIALVAL
jgi:hypothetical protein